MVKVIDDIRRSVDIRVYWRSRYWQSFTNIITWQFIWRPLRNYKLAALIKEKNISDGSEDVIDIDVSTSAAVAINNTFVGKFINITQSSGSSIPMIFTLSAFNAFETGDVLTFNASDSYVNYYFGVFYTDLNGAQGVVYPSESLRMIRTDNSWDISQDGRFTKAAIVTAGQQGVPLVGNESSIQNVQAISAVENDAVQILDDGNGHRTLEFDLNKLEPTSLTDNAPYRVYKSVSEIESDFGPITITPLRWC